MELQLVAMRRAKATSIQRAFHAKPLFATSRASLQICGSISPDLCAGWVQPGRTYTTIVRFSNASPISRPDSQKDLRGVALRITVSDHQQHDLLMTNFPVSHARDARQFVAFAKATSGSPLQTILGIFGLVVIFGPFQVFRMLRNIARARRRIPSLASATFWSRGAYRWGETLAVRFLLRGTNTSSPEDHPSNNPDCLTEELANRLSRGDVTYTLLVQRYIDNKATPIEDASVEWAEKVSPPERVGILTISQQDTGTAAARADAASIETLRFNPWNTTDQFRPLGNLNRARKVVYDAGSAQRLAYRWLAQPPLRNAIFGAGFRVIFRLVNRFVAWYRLPPLVGLLNLDAYRHVLRDKNLLDTDIPETPPKPRHTQPNVPETDRAKRTLDGTFNDLSAPEMGSLGAVFGRNIRPIYRPDLFNEPSPIVISERLLARERFIPATSLNILAAAWIQFQVHDWVSHERYRLAERSVDVPLPPGETRINTVGGQPEHVMRIAENKLAGNYLGCPILFKNNTTHWWDSSELYGAAVPTDSSLREGPKLRLPGGYLPEERNGQEITGFNEAWWLGLSAMHTLFAREHNVVCDELRQSYPAWSDERVFETARLIVSALIAKIHTVEWTPAILATEAIKIGLNSNWNGPPSNWFSKAALWLLDSHSLTGITKTLPDHNGAPYSLTEDFITVYRMHPLIPDDYSFFNCNDGRPITDRAFSEIQGSDTDRVMRETGLGNVLYSFGIANPGAITLHNFPQGLRKLERDGEVVDLSVVDIVRTRRRGVPRFNDFREALHKPRITRWEDLSANPESVRRIKEVYGKIDLVDTVVGLLAETPPPGFGFSDTAFRIFILMASRRLQSDRFLTVDFRPEIYSPLGMDWIATNSMTSVILRHCPELAAIVPQTASAFAPWRRLVHCDFKTS